MNIPVFNPSSLSASAGGRTSSLRDYIVQRTVALPGGRARKMVNLLTSPFLSSMSDPNVSAGQPGFEGDVSVDDTILTKWYSKLLGGDRVRNLGGTEAAGQWLAVAGYYVRRCFGYALNTEYGDPILSTGSRGPDVKRFQQLLNLFREPDAQLKADGIWGPRTAAAAAETYAGFGLDVNDGTYDLALFIGADPKALTIDPTQILGYGSRGERVTKLQQFYNDTSLEPKIAEDGIFGPETAQAVHQLRQSKGIPGSHAWIEEFYDLEADDVTGAGEVAGATMADHGPYADLVDVAKHVVAYPLTVPYSSTLDTLSLYAKIYEYERTIASGIPAPADWISREKFNEVPSWLEFSAAAGYWASEYPTDNFSAFTYAAPYASDVERAEKAKSWFEDHAAPTAQAQKRAQALKTAMEDAKTAAELDAKAADSGPGGRKVSDVKAKQRAAALKEAMEDAKQREGFYEATIAQSNPAFPGPTDADLVEMDQRDEVARENVAPTLKTVKPKSAGGAGDEPSPTQFPPVMATPEPYSGRVGRGDRPDESGDPADASWVDAAVEWSRVQLPQCIWKTKAEELGKKGTITAANMAKLKEAVDAAKATFMALANAQKREEGSELDIHLSTMMGFIAPFLYATAWHESAFRYDAKGDFEGGVPRSYGFFQLYAPTRVALKKSYAAVLQGCSESGEALIASPVAQGKFAGCLLFDNCKVGSKFYPTNSSNGDWPQGGPNILASTLFVGSGASMVVLAQHMLWNMGTATGSFLNPDPSGAPWRPLEFVSRLMSTAMLLGPGSAKDQSN